MESAQLLCPCSGAAAIDATMGDAGDVTAEQKLPTETAPTASQSSPTKEAEPGPFAESQGQLQSRLNKIYQARDVIGQLLEQLIEKADAIAGHASNASEVGSFLEPLMDAFTSLDKMYLLLFKVNALLTEEDIFANPELPQDGPSGVVYPHPHRGA